MASEGNEQLEKTTALGASLQAKARGNPGNPEPWELPSEEGAQREGTKSETGWNQKAQALHLES